MLGFVYWHNSTDSSHETAFNGATTAGCIVGMFGFGFLADLFDRRKLYGYEIVVLIAGTVGVVMSSTGYFLPDRANAQNLLSLDFASLGFMDMQQWLLFWRFISGVGIGGDRSLSLVIVSEFASTYKRPDMLVTVFTMQSFAIATG